MKRILNAFVIGGAFGIVGQLFIFMWAAILGVDSAQVSPPTMVTMGVLGLVLFLTGTAAKLEERTTMGVTIPISGMVVAIGGVTFGAKMESGSAATGAKAGAGLPLRVLGTGAAISVALSALLWFTTHGSLEIAFELLDMGPVLLIVMSFLVGGGIAAIAEAILLATKAPIPVLLICFIVVGALISAFNLDASPLLTNGGFVVSLLAAGQAAYETFQLLLMGITPVPFITVLGVYLSVTVLGMLAGLVKRP